MSNLNRVVDLISRFEGVLGILLFGSMARGDYDEYSDHDLLIVFKDKSSMWKSWDNLFEVVSSLRMNLHVIPESLEEFKTANPVFLEELFKHGKFLFARFPMKVSYFLYRKGGGGVVTKVGGIKLNEGCVLIPKSAAEEIVGFLKDFGIKTRKLEVGLSDKWLKAFSIHNLAQTS
ncbi:MAG: nucleotidyltransferase domain-containing protein [Candidatus Bathyarchaeia archaeon]|nr:nucleotidyltransferase domain-containing protein [Candidatus Bathyarchaeota archaeon]